jgi:gliding motility-associated-like protein
MKKIIVTVLFVASTFYGFSAHITGGELGYEYFSQASPTSDFYKVILRLYKECGSNNAALPNQADIWIYNTNTMTYVKSTTVGLEGGFQTINMVNYNIPCLQNRPPVCFELGYYVGLVELPRSAAGYTLSYYTCCRVGAIKNLFAYDGANYMAVIPGTSLVPNARNSSPFSTVRDTTLVCNDEMFSLDYSATDTDGDSISYSFCTAYNADLLVNGNQPVNPMVLETVDYASPVYTAAQPMGSGVNINARTGVISGLAPSVPGKYLLAVCVTEWRNGVAIGSGRKDFILTVANCDIPRAQLQPEYILCKSFTNQFQNESTSSGINTYFWDFGVRNQTNDTSNLPTPTFTYPDTGTYTIKLVVNRNNTCTDSTEAIVKIYPVFTAAFDISSACIAAPIQFTDRTTTTFGTVDKWRWDFGEGSTLADTSNNQNVAYTYPFVGDKEIKLIVGNSKGCIDSLKKIITVSDKPPVGLSAKDTLICKGDTIQISANIFGNFTWQPNVNIINASTTTPSFFPAITTTYKVLVTDGVCSSQDSVRIRVVDFITVSAGADHDICLGDSIQLTAVSEAFKYSWSPIVSVSNPLIKNPFVNPITTTNYVATATLGHCVAKDTVRITVYNPPTANAGPDSTICYGNNLVLQGNYTGRSFAWSPTAGLVNPISIRPIAAPLQTTWYVLSAFGVAGCNRTVFDSVRIFVTPPVPAFAGNDTLVVVGQPLQLNATGGTNYAWSPAFGLSNTNIANPVAMFTGSTDSIRYRVTVSDGYCSATDDINITVFKTEPDIFIPTAFTPNNDYKNDVLKAVPVGLKQFLYFRIYNRLGQIVFSTKDSSKGWDGKINGIPQQSSTYIFSAEGLDFTGKKIIKKGTVLLLR